MNILSENLHNKIYEFQRLCYFVIDIFKINRRLDYYKRLLVSLLPIELVTSKCIY